MFGSFGQSGSSGFGAAGGGFGGFGQQPQPQQQPQQQQQQPQQQQTGFGGFGAAQTQPAGTGNPVGFGGFGSSTTTQGGFGAAQPAFGAAASGFRPAGTTSGFGAAPTAGFGAGMNPTGSSAFGAATGGFGSSTTANRGGFGSSTAPTTGFGAKPAATGFGLANKGFGGFGAATGTQQGFGTSTDPSSANPLETGTTNAPYETKTEKNETITHVCANKPYRDYPIELLRLRDYELQKNPAGPSQLGVEPLPQQQQQQQGTTGFGGFGSSTTGNAGGFGSTASTQPATGFGGFGSTATTQPATGFGGFGASTTQPTVGGFGAAPAAGSGAFGGFGASATSQPAAGGFGGFGSTQNNAASTGLFGQKPAATGFGTSSNIFGAGAGASTGGFGTAATTQPQTGFGSFGQKPATLGGFGQPTGGFGAPASTAAAPFGTATAAPTAGGLFGQKPAGTGLFNAPTTTAGGFFGSTAAPAQTSTLGGFGQSSGGLFGGNTAQTGFGAAAKPAAFSFGATTAPTTNALPASAPFSFSNQFGAAGTNNTATGGFGGFGGLGTTTSVPASTSAPAFGGFSFNQATTTAPAAGSTFSFGNTASTGGLFGQQSQAPASTALGSFPQTGSLGFNFGSTNNTATSQPFLPFGGLTTQPLNSTQPLVAKIDGDPYGSLNINVSLKAEDKVVEEPRLFSNPKESKPEISMYAKIPARDASRIKLRSYGTTPLRAVPNLNGISRYGSAFTSVPRTERLVDLDPRFTPRRSVRRLVIEDPDSLGNGTIVPGSLNGKLAPNSSISRTKLGSSYQFFNAADDYISSPSVAPQNATPARATATNAFHSQKSSPSSSPQRHDGSRLLNQSNLNRSPGTELSSSSSAYVFSPSISELKAMNDAKLSAVSNFSISLPSYGKVVWLEPVNMFEVSPTGDRKGFDQIPAKVVIIKSRQVIVYPDEENKPEIGKGLNKPAQIELYNCWPLQDRKVPIKDVTNPKYISHLKKMRDMPDTKFISFADDTGTWTFTVEHFSKYGFEDDDEADDNGSANQSENVAVDANAQKIESSPFFEVSQHGLVAGGKQTPALKDSSNEPTKSKTPRGPEPLSARKRQIVDLSRTWGSDEEVEREDDKDSIGYDMPMSIHDQPSVNLANSNTPATSRRDRSPLRKYVAAESSSDDEEDEKTIQTAAKLLTALIEERNEKRVQYRRKMSDIFDMNNDDGRSHHYTPQSESLSATPFTLSNTTSRGRKHTERKQELQSHSTISSPRNVDYSSSPGTKSTAVSRENTPKRKFDESKTFFARAFLSTANRNEDVVDETGVSPEQIVPSINDKIPSEHLRDALNNFRKMPKLDESLSGKLLFKKDLAVTSDVSLMMSRSFRVGWGPRGTLVSLSPAGNFSVVEIRKVTQDGLKSTDNIHNNTSSTSSTIYKKSLETLLKFSHFNPQSSSSDIIPRVDISSKLQFRDFVQSLSGVCSAEEMLIWKLAVALFDDVVPSTVQKKISEMSQFVFGARKNIIEDGFRREAISRWFIEACRRNVKTLLQQPTSNKEEQDAHKILALMSGRDMVSALEECMKTRNLKLATVISQVGGPSSLIRALNTDSTGKVTQQTVGHGVPARGGTDPVVAFHLQKQVQIWHTENNTNETLGSGSNGKSKMCISETRLNLWELISGDVSLWSSGVYRYAQDWRQLLALFLWYGNNGSWSVDEAFRFFDSNRAVHGMEPTISSHSHAATSNSHTDICFELLRLFVDGDTRLEEVLSPNGIGQGPLAFRLPWLLWVVLSRSKRAKEFTDAISATETSLDNVLTATGDRLTLAFASELEAHGLWEWAIAVAMHLSSSGQRRAVCEQLVSRNSPGSDVTAFPRSVLSRLSASS